MPIYSDRLNIAYFPVPKIGSSTMRSVLYAVNNDLDVSQVDAYRVADKTTREIRARSFEESRADLERKGRSYQTVAIVREPVKRFVSGYVNKILSGQLRRLMDGADTVKSSKLPTEPDLDLFLRKFDRYRAKSGMIKRHFMPMTYYLGNDLAWFDHVFHLERFDDVTGFLDRRYGAPISYPHKKKSRKVDIALTPEQEARIRQIFRADLELLGLAGPKEPAGAARGPRLSRLIGFGRTGTQE